MMDIDFELSKLNLVKLIADSSDIYLITHTKGSSNVVKSPWLKYTKDRIMRALYKIVTKEPTFFIVKEHGVVNEHCHMLLFLPKVQQDELTEAKRHINKDYLKTHKDVTVIPTTIKDVENCIKYLCKDIDENSAILTNFDFNDDLFINLISKYILPDAVPARLL